MATSRVKYPTLKGFDYWTLNGVKTTAKSKLEAGKVNTIALVIKDVKRTALAAPTIASATKNDDDTYSVTLACADAGAKIQYDVNNSGTFADYKGYAFQIAKTDYLVVKSVAVPGATEGTLPGFAATYYFAAGNTTGEVSAWKLLAGDQMGVYVGKSTTKWSETAGVKAAIEAGNAELAKYTLATDDEWDAAVKTGSKGTFEAVAAEAKAQLAAYENGAMVIVGDKAYTMGAKELKAAQDAVAAQEAVITKKGKAVTGADYSAAANAIVAAVNGALKNNVKLAPVTAADINAAKAVTEALKAATTGEAAEAALAQLAALTDTQKKLVDIADIAAAEKVRDEAAKAEAEKEAAAALVKEQDIAAVKYVNSTKTKTVKLATAKKGTASITYKSQVYASGNKVTYAKVSGAKIKVSKAGKVTLKKVTKAGTYTGKVKVTCGDATRTVKVKFFVK